MPTLIDDKSTLDASEIQNVGDLTQQALVRWMIQLVDNGTVDPNAMSKVIPSVGGNIPMFDGTGDVIDVGISPSTFALAAQGALADTALQDITVEVINSLSDVNVGVPGAAQDGYVLSWDDVTSKFVLIEQTAAGVTDHSVLTNLTADDHTQYHTDVRGDVRYYTKALLDGGQLNNLYYTETEADSLLAGKADDSTVVKVTDNFDTINDVTYGVLEALADDQILYRSGGVWTNVTSTALRDANLSMTPSDQQLLVWDSGNGHWTNSTATLTDMLNDIADNEVNGLLINSEAGTSFTMTATGAGFEHDEYTRFTSSTAVTVTVDDGGQALNDIGKVVHFHQDGTGVVSFVEGVGVTINSSDGSLSLQQGQTAIMQAVGQTEWDLQKFDKGGAVGSHTHVKADITDFNEANYATAAQGALADTALQPGDVDPVSINNQTGTSYVFVLLDAGKYVRVNNATSSSVTVPANSSVAFEIGTQLLIRQVGTGQVTIVEDAGVVVNTAETLKLHKQHSTATLIKVGTDEWDLVGDLEEA